MDFSCKPINPFQDDGLSKEDRAMINGMRETAYVCGKRGGDVEHAVHQTLKRMGRYDLLPPCERKSEKNKYEKEEIWITTYWSTEIEPVVSPFYNQEAAETCARYYKRQGYKVCIDKCDIFHKCTYMESEDKDE